MSAESSFEQFEHYDSGPTSNDLLESLIAENTPAALGDRMVAQGPEGTGNIEGTPGITLAPCISE
jgi:hypothetical protein